MSSLPDLEMSDPYRTLGYALKQAQQALRTYLDTQLRAIGLTTPQYSVLAGLEVSAGLSSAELARQAFVTPQTMQAIIATLERTGLIERAVHPTNSRILTTQLTSAGRSALNEAHKMVAKAELLARKAVAPFDPEEMSAVLLRIAEAMR